MNFNKTILMGFLTRDPETRYAQTGTAITNFGMAVNRSWRTESGETKEEVSFFDLVAFGRTGEAIAQYCKKGSPLFVEGRLKQEVWDDKQTGAKRYAVKIIVESFQFIGGKTDSAQVPSQEPRRAAVAAPVDAGGHGGDSDDESVPF